MKSKKRSAAFSATLLGAPLVASAAPQYAVTDLGVTFVPTAINDQGQVVGYETSTSVARASLYSAGQFTDLGASLAYDINGSTQIAVTVNNQAAIHNSAGNHPLTPLANATGVTPNGLNDSDSVAVTAIVNGISRGYSYTNGNYTSINVGTNASSTATAINNSGWVVGSGYNTDQYSTLYKPGVGAIAIPKLSADTQSTGRAINNAGDLVGDGPGVIAARNRAYEYSATGSLTELMPLTVPATFARNTYATGINDARTVVGYTGNVNNPASGQTLATVWFDSAAPVNLTSLLDTTGAGWTLSQATGINTAGQIIGTGDIDDDGVGPDAAVAHSFLISPVPEPGVFSMMIGCATLSLRRRRQAR